MTPTASAARAALALLNAGYPDYAITVLAGAQKDGASCGAAIAFLRNGEEARAREQLEQLGDAA